MATDSKPSTAFPESLPVPLGQAQDVCNDPPVVPEQELALVIPMTPKRTCCGVGRIASRTRAMPEPIVELDVE